MNYAWNQIARHLDNIALASSGFSSAHRGIVTLPDGQQVFVKVGTDELTKKWAQKEVQVYRFLQNQGYSFMPELQACSDDGTGFALAPLQDSWDWSDTWSEARLEKTLEAMDVLAAIKPFGSDVDIFSDEVLDQNHDGWQQLSKSPELQRALLKKLQAAEYYDLAASLDFSVEARRSASFVFNKDTLVHDDVRADNCAWNADQQMVNLVDWNWTQLGSRQIDQAATLVHVHKSGLDVLQNHAARLDPAALHWVAGFWFKASATPIWPGGPQRMRDIQLASAIAALDLASKLRS